MATDWKSVRILCPFYVGEDKNGIRCEGVFCESTCTTRFATIARKTNHQKEYCEKKYDGCGIYQAIMTRYKDQ